MMKKLYLLGLVFCSAFSLAACGHQSANDKHEISIASRAELSTADVSLAMDNESAEVAEQVNEGLYDFNAKGQIVPALAKGQPQVTNGGQTYTINLKHDGKWSNGKPVTANDFVYAWQRTVSPKTKSQQAYYLNNVQNYQPINKGQMSPDKLGIKALDKYQLQIQLNHPAPYFSSILAMSASFPLNKQYVEAQGKKYGTDADHTLYDGPFTLANWDGTSDTWTYVKNKYYRDKKHVHLDKINVAVTKSQNTGAYQFESKELALVPLMGSEIKDQAQNKDLYVRKVPATMYLEYNTQKKLFSNEQVRQAFSKSLDLKQLTGKVLQDKSTPATGFVPMGFKNSQTGVDFAKQAGQLTQYDPQEARQLWRSGLRELGMKSAKCTILSSNDDNSKKIDEFIQSNLEKHLPNLQVSIKSVPFNSRLTAAKSGDFDVILNGWTPTYADPTDFLNLLQSDNSNNDGKFKDSQYDQLLETANNQYASAPAKRWETMQAANRYVVDKAPLTPLYYLSEVYLISPKLKGVVMGPMGFPYYKNANWQ
ncbi:peptide ABC transporter substrate-binding protein [Bombilactobacillus thymidiniphilus]|uniref:Peptide ABC transporter substrate-binding protein n=1 Tax=Bombilactobacillus thymidiniphilus TaxID=2923363 RepID=A0ABY4PBK1_9LACO|nr:peptide ABC transporter substrate-binding protein [Bombilactobacillus thymidiniphilus]UQS82980.1 peptide ABC transporter substrate-binding protein [Bombilactobacillus thymidiniphilus]